ncbi:MAG: ABC transporter ATP-binding protein [Planctomycetes bacterium]|nr:ABC transporter ATP-binding protein [Planctomycetota bacterium]MCR4318233.1 ABC transporter ATP-binding protein [Planctomycetota bacterium]
MNAAITFSRVTKVFQHRQVALADVSFEVPKGVTVGLLGANGAGKSTAIRIALGLITASAGDVQVFGEAMHPGAKSLRQRMGFLSDDPAYPRDLTAISYLAFVGKCFGMPRKERLGRMGTLLRAVGLTDDAGRKIGTFSTGMKTRLGIAASLMNDPEILIWDEPTSGLDPISRRQTLDLLDEYHGKKTIVLSSHILGDVDRVCDRLLVLNQGQVLFDGHRGELENQTREFILELRLEGAVGDFRAAMRSRLGREDLCQDGGTVRIELSGAGELHLTVESLLALAKETGVTIAGINSTSRRLEDAYLKLISEDEYRGLLRVAES